MSHPDMSAALALGLAEPRFPAVEGRFRAGSAAAVSGEASAAVFVAPCAWVVARAAVGEGERASRCSACRAGVQARQPRRGFAARACPTGGSAPRWLVPAERVGMQPFPSLGPAGAVPGARGGGGVHGDRVATADKIQTCNASATVGRSRPMGRCGAVGHRPNTERNLRARHTLVAGAPRLSMAPQAGASGSSQRLLAHMDCAHCKGRRNCQRRGGRAVECQPTNRARTLGGQPREARSSKCLGGGGGLVAQQVCFRVGSSAFSREEAPAG